MITLRTARELSGFSIEDVAVICNIPSGDIEKYERDTRCIPFELAKRMKRLFRISFEQIYIGLEPEYGRHVLGTKSAVFLGKKS